MEIKDICNLPIKNLIDKNCILFLWTTNSFLENAFKVINSWGFNFKTLAFDWLKIWPKKIGIDGITSLKGMSYYTKTNNELCLLAIKGKIKPISHSVSGMIISVREKHSKKPDEIRNRIVQLVGDLPRLELFARQKTEGWDVWGNEIKNDINL